MKSVFSLLLILFSIQVYAQRGSIAGNVTEDGEGLSSVNILLMETGIGTVSEVSGKYEIRNIPEGEYRIRFSAVGYETIFYNIRIDGGKTTELNVKMKTAAIDIGAVEVTDTRRQSQEDTRTSLIDLSPRNAKILPGAAEDVLRTLQSLPGVLGT
jgi:iron complex outermembrane recepter protein